VKERLPRKLAAILHADIAGYSRLAGEDEDTTHRRLKESLDLISSTVTSYHGRVINYAGDAALAMFEAVVDAVSCAVAIQHDIAKFNQDVPDERKLQFRIGVNMGDVIEDSGDIFGDGVNVAARLEGLAEPGGICIAESVHIAVGSKLPLDYQDIGAQSVKNIAEPIRVYQVALKPGAELPQPTEDRKSVEPPKIKKWNPLAVALTIVLIVAVSAAYWLILRESEEVPASVEQKALSLPDKPSIAVLPFINMSSDKEQEYFVDGMTEDLITDLSKISGLFVIARNSVFTYKGESIDLNQVAAELGIRFILEGSVRRSDKEVRINAQLIDVSTGGHLWAERYDGNLDDVFALQDRVTNKIVSVLAVKLSANDDRNGKPETGNTDAYDEFLKGWNEYLKQTPKNYVRAISLFNKAVELDPSYSRAYAALAAVYWQSWKRLWHKEIGERRWHDARVQAEQFLSRAMQDPSQLAYQLSSAMSLQKGEIETAIIEAEKAIAMDPNDPEGYIALAGSLSYSGDAQQALLMVEQAMRLNPHYPPYYLYELGLVHFVGSAFDKAVSALEKAVALNPEDSWSQILLLATYGHLDRTDDAFKILDNLSRMNNYEALSVKTASFWHPFKESTDSERFADGLRRAGVPD
jgi:TolB-like protein/class 3 adenylate cyclase